MTEMLPTTDCRAPTITGLLGGSFDPIHNGHLALAQAALEQLQLDQVRFIPAGQPWQRAPLCASNAQRLRMVQQAIADIPQFVADDRELQRSGATYTVDTLGSLRDALGPHAVLVWILGSDQLHNLPSWHRFEALFELAHFAVAQRAGEAPLTIPAALTCLHGAAGDTAWRNKPAGTLIRFTMPPINLSASWLRVQLAHGHTPTELVPTPVLHYIQQHQLYGNHGHR